MLTNLSNEITQQRNIDIRHDQKAELTKNE